LPRNSRPKLVKGFLPLAKFGFCQIAQTYPSAVCSALTINGEKKRLADPPYNRLKLDCVQQIEGEIMKASSVCFHAAVLFALVGMLWGIQMEVTNDHSAFPAHAHLNLLGWVSLFPFGIYYRLHPSLDVCRSALIQVAMWCLGTIILTIGVALVHTGHESGDPIAALGSVIVLVGMALFAWLVYRQERAPVTCDKRPIALAE
jgi:hypothetical protein